MKYYEIFHRYATVAGCTLRTHFSLTDYTIFLVSENKNERVIAHILYVSSSLDYAYNEWNSTVRIIYTKSNFVSKYLYNVSLRHVLTDVFHTY